MSLNSINTDNDLWGYFQPGYFPIQNNAIAPAMICLKQPRYIDFDLDFDHGADDNLDIQFVLIKADCYLNTWEDALLISETILAEAKKESIQPNIHTLMNTFMAKGYISMQKIKPHIEFLNIH